MKRSHRTSYHPVCGEDGFFVRGPKEVLNLCNRIGPAIVEFVGGHPRGARILHGTCLLMMHWGELGKIVWESGLGPPWLQTTILEWWNTHVPPHPSEVDPL